MNEQYHIARWISNWVEKNYGKDEVYNPSWCIEDIAKELYIQLRDHWQEIHEEV